MRAVDCGDDGGGRVGIGGGWSRVAPQSLLHRMGWWRLRRRASSWRPQVTPPPTARSRSRRDPQGRSGRVVSPHGLPNPPKSQPAGHPPPASAGSRWRLRRRPPSPATATAAPTHGCAGCPPPPWPGGVGRQQQCRRPGRARRAQPSWRAPTPPRGRRAATRAPARTRRAAPPLGCGGGSNGPEGGSAGAATAVPGRPARWRRCRRRRPPMGVGGGIHHGLPRGSRRRPPPEFGRPPPTHRRRERPVGGKARRSSTCRSRHRPPPVSARRVSDRSPPRPRGFCAAVATAPAADKLSLGMRASPTGGSSPPSPLAHADITLPATRLSPGWGELSVSVASSLPSLGAVATAPADTRGPEGGGAAALCVAAAAVSARCRRRAERRSALDLRRR